jgi:arabinogalactan oligomer / maltooligosaccharide transport system permease protein
MTTIEHREAAALVHPKVIERRRRPRRFFGGTWWRHAVGVVAAVIALFPVVYVISAAFNADESISGSSLIPREVTLDNFRTIFSGEVTGTGGTSYSPYFRWYLNSVLVAGVTALLTVLLGALAAYAFSRFRFRGRRMGMLTLLLIQMFPPFLAIVALYLILLNTGKVFPAFGLNTLTGLVLVYLGSALGVNAWLMKGFFDTIPAELDESARVDGATPAQIFWGVILPLAAPVLAVVGILSFVGTLNEFILASALLQTTDNFTLPVGLQNYIDQQYSERWGPFAAGVLLAAIPVVIIVMSFQRFFIRGLTQGAVKG